MLEAADVHTGQTAPNGYVYRVFFVTCYSMYMTQASKWCVVVGKDMLPTAAAAHCLPSQRTAMRAAETCL